MPSSSPSHMISVSTKLGEDINGEAADDRSGWSVSLSSDGRTVAIGAPYSYGNGDDSGLVRIFGYSNSTWTKRGLDINGTAGDRSGCSVSLSSDGRTVAIGSPYNNGNSKNSGLVRIFAYVNSTWTKRGQDIIGEAAGDRSGWSVSLSCDGCTVAIGAPSNFVNGKCTA